MTDTIKRPAPSLMAMLAGQANNYYMTDPPLQSSGASRVVRGLNYPDGWSVIKHFTGTTTSSTPRAQGFLAKGYLDPDNPNPDEVIAALVLGVSWSEFLKSTAYNGSNQTILSTTITRETSPNNSLLIEFLFMNSYLFMRNAIWAALKELGTDMYNNNFYICGMGLGAPLAQLAALDLKPSTSYTGPGGQLPPVQQPICYVFSAPNVANSSLVSYYNINVQRDGSIATDTYWARKSGETVDYLPTEPDTNILGNSKLINDVVLPDPDNKWKYDVPWLERGNVFYISQLGGELAVGPKIKPDNQFPNNFKLSSAYNFARLTAVGYSQVQGSSSKQIGQYVLQTHVVANGVPFAFIFTDSNNLVVAFRGSHNWDEAYEITSNTNIMIPPEPMYGGAGVHTGAYKLYNAPTKGDSSVLFKDAIVTEIKKYIGNRDLYITGHSIGGALANLAALDYSFNTDRGLSVKQVYTFGAICLGAATFKNHFDPILGDRCFQVRRIFDKISTSLLTNAGFYQILNNSIVLGGQLNEEENTYHSIAGYIELLNMA